MSALAHCIEIAKHYLWRRQWHTACALTRSPQPAPDPNTASIQNSIIFEMPQPPQRKQRIPSLQPPSLLPAARSRLRSAQRIPRTALIIVDVQNDFITGSLALARCPAGEDGAEVIEPINRLLRRHKFDFLIYTMDYHPPDHVSFAQWPPHCIAGTGGAELHRDLFREFPDIEHDNSDHQNNNNNRNTIITDYSDIARHSSRLIVVKKGVDRRVDCYSPFCDNDRASESGLCERLRKSNIENVLVCGLAFDVCVARTAIDSAISRFRTAIIADCCRAINPAKSAARHEIDRQLAKHRIEVIQSSQLVDFCRVVEELDEEEEEEERDCEKIQWPKRQKMLEE